MERFSFDIQKVHKLNLKITCFMVVLIVMPLIITNGISESTLYIIASLNVIGCGFLNYFINIPNKIKAVLFAALQSKLLLDEIAAVFNDVKLSSDISNDNLQQSVRAIEKVSHQFVRLLQEIDSVSALSQQNNKATEEIVSSIYEENKLLEAIGTATEKLQLLNRDLIVLTN